VKKRAYEPRVVLGRIIPQEGFEQLSRWSATTRPRATWSRNLAGACPSYRRKRRI